MNGITHWDPFHNLSTLQEQVDRLFDSKCLWSGENSTLTAWVPAVDVYETEDELVIKADLPEVAEKDLDVRIENNKLTIRGERKFEQKVKEENYLRVERSFGSFSRSFTLPHSVDTQAIKAQYTEGVLAVTLPKRAESKPKQVKINVTANGKN